MAALSSINIRFSVNLSEFSTALRNSLRDIDKASQQLQSVGRGLSAAVTLPLVGLGIASLKTFGDIQALQKGLISVMGSAEAAAIEFEKLKEVAKLPGLGLEEAVRGSVNLQAAGFSADEARSALLAFGNALATVGKGKRELDLVTLAITQLNNKSGGFGQDLRQLTEQLPQLRGALSSAFGTVDTEKISKSGVTGKQVVNALITEFQKLPKVTGGINNSFENFADSTKLALSSFGEAINKAFNVEGLLNSLGEAIGNLAERFSNLSPEAQKVILVISGIAAAIGPLFLTLGVLGSTIPTLVTGFITLRTAVINFTASIAANPIGAIAVALGLVVGALYLYNTETKKTIEQNTLLNKVNDNANAIIGKQKIQLETLLQTARDETKSKKDRLEAIAKINKISPEYLGNLTLENINTDKARAAIEKYNVALLAGAKARAAQNLLVELSEKEVKLEIEKAKAKTELAAEFEKLNNKQSDNSVLVAQNNKLYKDQNGLQATLQKSQQLKTDAEKKALTDIYNANKQYLDLLKDVTTGTEANTEANKTALKAGTVAFYEAQISALQKLQKETATSSLAWNVYEKSIGDVQKKIDELTGKAGVKLPKPELPTLDTVAPPEFALSDLKDQKSYYENLRNQYATTSEEYKKLSENINNTQIKINAIEGVDELKASTDEVKQNLSDFSSELSNTITQGLSQFSEGFIQAIADGGNAFNAVGNLLFQTIGNMMVSLGKAAIQIGITMLAIKAAFTSPLAALASGAALIIAGTLIKAQVQDAGAFANGGVVGGTSFAGDKLFARVNSGEMILNGKQQANLSRMINPAITAGDVAIQLIGGLKISGSDLELVLMRNDNRNKRIK